MKATIWLYTALLLGLATLFSCHVHAGPGMLINPYWATATTPTLPAGIKHRWKASDLSSTPVSTWTDSVSGYNWTQTTGANQPAWSTNGVTFDGVNDSFVGTNLTSNTQIASGAYAWLLVFAFNTAVLNDKVIMGSALSGGTMFVAIGDPSGTPSTGFYDGSVNNAIPLESTNTFDFFACATTNSPDIYHVYTNGITAWQNNVNAWNTSITISHIGSGNGNAFWRGTLKEVIVWTNNLFTAAQLAQVHSYVTNTYTNVSP